MDTPNTSHQLRAFDARYDLNNVADLVELCFNDTLDAEGKDYIKQMRRAAENPAMLHWANAVGERASMPLSGYVWLEDDQIVGNLSMIPYYPDGKKFFLIANVAVHPSYRHQGVATKLTIKAIEHARNKGASVAWLHVREENSVAHNLYLKLGFKEQARRTTWLIKDGDHIPGLFHNELSVFKAQDNFTINNRVKNDWQMQKLWLEHAYPPELNWQLAINFKQLMPGLKAGLYRFITDTPIQQWSITKGRKLLGVLASSKLRSHMNNLWLAVHPDSEEVAAYHLLNHASHQRTAKQILCLDFPAGRAVDAIQAVGFCHQQTLIWMSLLLQKT